MWETQRSTSGFVYKIFNGFNFVCNQIVFLLQLNEPVVVEPASLQKQIGWKKSFTFLCVQTNFLLTDRAVSLRAIKTSIIRPSTWYCSPSWHFYAFKSRRNIFSFEDSSEWYFQFHDLSEPLDILFISSDGRRNFPSIFHNILSFFWKAYILLSLLNHKIVFSGECTPWEGKRQRSGSRKTSTQLN